MIAALALLIFSVSWVTLLIIAVLLALYEQRLGHDVPGMRGLYAHISPRMRDDLIAALQARWEKSLRERASIDPRSPVLLLDNLLAPFRAGQRTISQIPPRTATAPILSVG